MWMWMALALVAGASSAVQGVFNGKWNRTVELPLTLLVNAGIVLIGAAALPLISKGSVTSENISKLDWTIIVGGVCGLLLIGCMAVSVPKIGVALAVALFVLGQALTAVCFEHFGWFGQHTRQIDWTRLLGVLMLLGGVVLIQYRR